MRELKPRRPLVAILLAAHIPGLGQMYNGELLMGALLVIGASAGLAGLFQLGILQGIKGLVWGSLLLTVFYAYQIVDAGIGASRRFDFILKQYNHWHYYAAYTLCFLLCSVFVYPPLAIQNNPIQVFKIQSQSMAPVLLKGDHILADTHAFRKNDPKRWDVILFADPKKPDRTLLKRVVGLPGETLEIRLRNLIINGKPVADAHAQYRAPLPSNRNELKTESFGPVIIPDGKFFVMGDNRDSSKDSRHFGMVEGNAISARAWLVLFSWDTSRVGIPIQ
ncbi:MAG: signal peptidase I [Desulfatibacillum sp.]|nr:signal peptidase I [Desulfatibacillum sp.]